MAILLENCTTEEQHAVVRFFQIRISLLLRFIAIRILVGKAEGKTPLGRQRRTWVDNTKMDFREIGWDGMDWIDLAQDRDQWRALVNTVMNLRVP
jgi:hypothetical protein